MSAITGKNCIGFNFSAAGKESFKAFSPAAASYSEEDFFYATEAEIAEILNLSERAFKIYRAKSGAEKASFLDAIADEIGALGDELIERCVSESALPAERITGERGRTVSQLKLFAQTLQEGSWVSARIDTAIPDRVPPKPDLRRMSVPIGPVLVFGASNFPLAFSTAGGDTASALAAGCPVIIKAHPSHPGTNDLVSQAIIKAAKRTGMPEGVFGMFYADNNNTINVVKNPVIKAIGFTGSRSGGMAIFKAAMERKDPIPVYAEMSSINPVVILPGCIKEKSEATASGLAASITLGVGQFCTNPGIVFLIKDELTNSFIQTLAGEIKAAPAGTMLNQSICSSYCSGTASFKKIKGVNFIAESEAEANPERTQVSAALFTTDAALFIKNKALMEEVFGPSSLLVLCENYRQLEEAIQSLDGQLTATIHAGNEDLPNVGPLTDLLTDKAGRVLFGGFPTGVEVCPSQQHGGPFPATTDARTTSVGTAAIERFVRPVALQNFPDQLLPAELKDNNPLHIFRLVNSEWTKNPVSS
ncbi:aldehyde dehydrogenase (NADP(+)) [Rubrolithibacter danxiaensis]|uniref:aldehyde dehydrogenase (NADP(+)) n=1 Tax=Rubrolithibacter danxiaensis TaxID=3390805 RepID=UPI003BF7FB76